MVLCDMCGTKEATCKCKVEGVIMTACEGCARFGTVLARVEKEEKKQKPTDLPQTEREGTLIQVIVPDFAKRIKDARERKRLKQDEFAKIISERESVIHNLESGHMRPGIDLARKLEKALRITLVDTVEDSPRESKKTRSDTLTLGDILKP
jgi:putative transcription factor